MEILTKEEERKPKEKLEDEKKFDNILEKQYDDEGNLIFFLPRKK